jgi:hypothetical protein
MHRSFAVFKMMKSSVPYAHEAMSRTTHPPRFASLQVHKHLATREPGPLIVHSTFAECEWCKPASPERP